MKNILRQFPGGMNTKGKFTGFQPSQQFQRPKDLREGKEGKTH
jgi:hypothetical protein